PGRVPTKAMAPNATAVARPEAAPRPAAEKAHAAAPSRGPHPARLRGTADTRSTTRARGSSSVTGVRTPTVRAASTNVARWPPTAITEATTMPTDAGPFRSARRSAATRCNHRVARCPRFRATTTTATAV